MIEGLHFSKEALSNRPLFLSKFNDVNIYVEDLGKEYEYEELFERLFESNLKIFSIFPLGGKDAVIKGYQTKGPCDVDGKMNIFIVDGDFDNLWDDQKTIAPNLIYLTRYNIESYYCSKEAVIKFVRRVLRCTRKDAEENAHFDEWQQHVRDEIGKLFVLFAIVMRYKPELPSVNGAGKFLDKAGHVIPEEYENYYKMVSKELGSIEPYIEEIYGKIHSKFPGNEDNKVLSIVCGKCQFDSLCRQLTISCHRQINRENFRSALISNCDLEPLNFLKEQVLQLMADGILASNSA